MEKCRKRVSQPLDNLNQDQDRDPTPEENLEIFRKVQRNFLGALRSVQRSKKLKGRFRKKGKA